MSLSREKCFIIEYIRVIDEKVTFGMHTGSIYSRWKESTMTREKRTFAFPIFGSGRLKRMHESRTVRSISETSLVLAEQLRGAHKNNY
jgi:hypothetical protein